MVVEPATPEDITALQEKWDLTAQQIAFLLGISDYTLWRWMSDRSRIGSPLMLRLALEGLDGRLQWQQEQAEQKKRELRATLAERIVG